MQKLTYPNNRRLGTFKSLGMTSPLMALLPYTEQEGDLSKPRRKRMSVPCDNDTFVKPVKQSFVKNPRLMPMTRLMLTLISGWAGDGKPIETTTGVIAKHLRRSRRQVFRYLHDAVEEGYLFYTRTKDRVGRYTGIRIKLNIPAIRFTKFKKQKKVRKTAEPLAMTFKSEINTKHIYNKEKEDKTWKALLNFGETLGYFEKKDPPS